MAEQHADSCKGREGIVLSVYDCMYLYLLSAEWQVCVCVSMDIWYTSRSRPTPFWEVAPVNSQILASYVTCCSRLNCACKGLHRNRTPSVEYVSKHFWGHAGHGIACGALLNLRTVTDSLRLLVYHSSWVVLRSDGSGSKPGDPGRPPKLNKHRLPRRSTQGFDPLPNDSFHFLFITRHGAFGAPSDSHDLPGWK